MTTNHQIQLDTEHNWHAVSGEIPTPKPEELLIKVRASSVNPVDLKDELAPQPFWAMTGMVPCKRSAPL